MRFANLKWLLPAVLATGGWAQEVAANPSVEHNFPAVGVVSGQTIRITALNTVRTTVTTATTTLPCRVSVSFYDERGRIAKEETIDDLASGTAKWSEYSPQLAILVYPPPRIALAAVVQVSTNAPSSATSAGSFNPSCSVIPTLEIYDTSSNRTTLLLSGPALTPPVFSAPRRPLSSGMARSQDNQE
jgi:hypothetical protein